MSWETGKRTIFNVLDNHVGHSTQIRHVYEGDFITGVRLICQTCGYQLLQQDSPEPIPVQCEEVEGGSVVETVIDSTGWDSQSTGCTNDTAWDTSDREWST
jgi:hypothetical protein